MPQATITPPHPKSQAAIPSTVTLALWRVRRTWRLLLIAGIGIVAAVTLVCAVPLYSQVSMTAGLRGVLTATPEDSEVELQAVGNILSQTIVQQSYQSLNRVAQQQAGAYLLNKTELYIQVPPLEINAPAPVAGDNVALTGASIQEAARHLKVLRGRLPQPTGSTLEIAVTQSTAGYMKADIGTVLTLNFYFFGPLNPLLIQKPAQIVGIIAVPPGDSYWHGQNFEPPQSGLSLGPPTAFEALMSNDGFLAMLQQMALNQHTPGGLPFAVGGNPTLLWYYHLNASQIGIGQLDDLIGRLQVAQGQIGSSDVPGLSHTAIGETHLLGLPLETPQTSSTLERFRSRIAVVNIPVTLLLLQVVGLILFFVGMMAGLVVERQAEVITLLRSRGASRSQVLGAFVTQSFALAAIALVAGPLLALLTVRLLVQLTLSPADQQAFNVITNDPLQAALGVGWFALAAALSTVAAMGFAIRGTASRHVLDMRRESARATRRPFWQRVYLDVVAVVIALTGYTLSLYVTSSGTLDVQTHLLISAPLALIAPIFLVLAGMLLFLRCFPVLLRLLAWLASRRPGAPPMLALAQMARAPRQALRMVLLLALASSFASFALVFNTSEVQHIATMAAYQTGADFSGAISLLDYTHSIARQTSRYRSLPGVRSATLGYVTDAFPVVTTYQSTSFSIRAVDADTFAQTAIWTPQDSPQPLAALMRQLAAKRASAGTARIVPAVVDALTWQAFNLSTGATFILQVGVKTIAFTALAEVEHIPTVNDSLVSGKGNDYIPPGGVLADYQTLAEVYNASSGDFLTANYVWLRTSDNPALLLKVRAALSSGLLSLTALNDRRAMMARLETDPLYLALLNVLILGTATTILLALVGNLTASWLSARTRLLSFAVLRALGSTPGQVASVLAWEQVIVYTTALALGAVFGALLVVTIVPALVFTGIPSYTADITSGEFYVLQHLLPVQLVVPSFLVAVFGALVLICAAAIGMMARVASKPSLGQTLRLNAD